MNIAGGRDQMIAPAARKYLDYESSWHILKKGSVLRQSLLHIRGRDFLQATSLPRAPVYMIPGNAPDGTDKQLVIYKTSALGKFMLTKSTPETTGEEGWVIWNNEIIAFKRMTNPNYAIYVGSGRIPLSNLLELQGIILSQAAANNLSKNETYMNHRGMDVIILGMCEGSRLHQHTPVEITDTESLFDGLIWRVMQRNRNSLSISA
jgi:hypothetical protein